MPLVNRTTCSNKVWGKCCCDSENKRNHKHNYCLGDRPNYRTLNVLPIGRTQLHESKYLRTQILLCLRTFISKQELYEYEAKIYFQQTN